MRFDLSRDLIEKAQGLTRDVLREVIYYDSTTGGMYWRHGSRGRLPWVAAGGVRADGYVLIAIAGKHYYAHRLAWLYVHGEMPKGVVDHIDGNPLNNAIANLRVVDKRGNAENMRAATSASKTGYLGVYKRGDTGRYAAQIKVAGRRLSLGCFGTAEGAYEAYIKAKRELHTRSFL